MESQSGPFDGGTSGGGARGSSSGVGDQLGRSSDSRCTSTRTRVGGGAGGAVGVSGAGGADVATGAASGDASVTRMLTSLLAWGDGVRARAGGVTRRMELRRELSRREPVHTTLFSTNTSKN